MVSVGLPPKLAAGSADRVKALWSMTGTVLRREGVRQQVAEPGSRQAQDCRMGKQCTVLRPLRENLRFPQWWGRKPFYLDIKEKGTFEGFGQAQDHRRILWFSACPNRRLPRLQLCQVSSLIHSEASLPLPGTIPDLSLGQFHRFLPSSYFNLLSAVKACVQPPAFAQMEAGNQEGRCLAKIAPKRGPGGRE